ncbi:aprataxin [Hydra vulgaris]|uniref:Aprataxin n=1 Tax=Hydra vulgaris TaxID=6087 RepID=A0ABM4CYR7_HYDVU
MFNNVISTADTSSTHLKGSANSNNSWKNGLIKSLSDKKLIVKETDNLFVLKDKFPKAKHHYLVVSKYIPSIEALTFKDIELVKHMIFVGEALIKKNKKESYYGCEFQTGFHAIPSMNMLHMHVISCDFESIYMKNKKHWNSFTTEFFRPACEILKELSIAGKVIIDNQHYKSFLSYPLKCHKCSERPSNMPKLKTHIKGHANV